MGRRRIRILGWGLMLLLLILGLYTHVYVEGRPSQGRPQYVAMGSSFASGPGITEAADNSPWFCGRSRDNYAHQLAKLRGLSLVDVTCGGATTRHILDGGQLLQPAQIDAVTAETELVTVTIGGNDIGYMANMIALGCDGKTPWYVRALGACKTRSYAEMEQGLRKVLDQQIAIIAEVRRRAPSAKLVFVNYQTVLPASGTCERLGLSEEQVAQMREIAEQLADVTYAAAEGHGALYMDAKRLTVGHDVCAEDSWMSGMYPEGSARFSPLHTTLPGMTAIAQGLNEFLGVPRS